MAKLSMAQRRALPKSDFLVPSKAPGPGSYPVPDAGHAKAAIGLSGHAANPKAIVKKAEAKLGNKSSMQSALQAKCGGGNCS
jgi:hypothetical protein